jgi:hypothetical protein
MSCFFIVRGPISESEIVLFVLVLPFLIAARLWAGQRDRERIREYIENGGGAVLDIAWRPFDGPKGMRAYDVVYKTRHGKERTASCLTNTSDGPYWKGPEPPPGPHHRDKGPADVIVSEPDTPPEAIACLGCGAQIPANQIRCPHCGWSYK